MLLAARSTILSAAMALAAATPLVAQSADSPADTTAAWLRDTPRINALKQEALRQVEGMSTLTQQMVDQVFSYGELGFQEVETSRYLTGVLRRNGFTVQEGYAGMPTGWVARWGSGKPVIALGADIDGIPQASQMPGVACRAPMVEGAPGHGEGHNAGPAVVITAAIALKRIMERDRIPGTIVIWPGVAEELVGGKAWFVREGLFRDVDAVIFAHVGTNLSTSWGATSGTGLVSALFSFKGQTAHSAGAPWRGRSALDAVQLMDIAWNFRREHLRPQHRSHSVIVDGGDQPNVVPATASIWFYFRETEYPRIQELFKLGNDMAGAAATMTGTELESVRVLGAAWPRHFNRPIAEMMTANIRQVGMPGWSSDDQRFARAVQKELSQTERGLDTAVAALQGPVRDEDNRGGGSDDIGDVSWVVPTITLRFPSNIPGLPGHSWSDAIAMATPVAHKGATAGAKATALTMLDLLLKPELVAASWSYFRDVQTKDVKYEPLIRPEDRPATHLNTDILARHRAAMRPFYYDPARHRTYLQQLGVQYPTIRAADGSCPGPAATP